LNPDGELAALMARFPRPGRVEWIGVRPQRRAAIRVLAEVAALADRGLDGDHYGRSGGKRQVTLIQAEHLAVVSALLGLAAMDPARLRRNIVVSGINLYALRGRSFRIGEAVFEGSGECAPCSRMEETLGAGGYNAVRGHGGITCRVVEGGIIRAGDAVSAA
jgi:MOSC domain-containing protein YiiM